MKNKSKFALLLWGAAAFFSSATAQASPQQNIAGDRVFDSRVEQHVVSKAAPAPKRTRAKTPKARTSSTPGTAKITQITPPSFSLPPVSQNIGPRSRAGASTPLNGIVIYSDDWNGDYKYGMYSWPTDGSSTEPTIVALDKNMKGQAGVAVGNRYYMTYYEESSLGYIYYNDHYVFDMDTWETIEVKDAGTNNYRNIAFTLTYDATTDQIFGEFYNFDGDGYNFCTYNAEEHRAVYINEISGTMWNAMAVSPDGILYAIDYDGVLLSVDKTSGNTTRIGDTGIRPEYMSSAAIDQRTGRFYWSVSTADNKGYIYEINPATAEATLLYQCPNNEEITGMYVPVLAAADKAPDIATEFKGDFTEGSLAVNLSFNAPTTLFDGSPLDGLVDYVITGNGEQITSGTAAPGAAVTYNYTAPASGNYTFEVTCSNSEGDGPSAKLNLYLGIDNPTAPSDVILTYANNVFSLSWAPAKAEHDGYIADVTYTVKRIVNDGAPETVASGITECSFSEPYSSEGLAEVYYTVNASAGNSVSTETPSNRLTIGSILPPYEKNFLDYSDITGYTIIDANGDERTWDTSYSGVQISYSYSVALDDWLITPAIKLYKDKIYTFTVEAQNNSTNYRERIEVCMGKEPTADTMEKTIIEPVDVYDNTPMKFTAKIVSDETGDVFFGIHAISDPDQYYLYIREISISAGESTYAPGAVTDLKVTPGAKNPLEATVSFTAPAKAINGAELTAIDKIDVYRNEELITTLSDVDPGKEYSYSDILTVSGTYKYRVVASNESGSGLDATVSAYIGVPLVLPPANVNIAETENPGEITLTWDAATTTVHGNEIDPSFVKYNVLDKNGNTVARDLTDCTFTHQAVTDGQILAYYTVVAVTSAGQSQGATSDIIAVGQPYTLPFAESFDNGDTSTVFGMKGEDASWSIVTDDSYVTLTDFDGTNGYAMMNGPYIDSFSNLFTGKVTLNAAKPALTFAYYNLNSQDDTNTLEVSVITADSQKHPLATFVQNDGKLGWNYVILSLSDFAGQTVQINFLGTVVEYQTIMIDAIYVGELKDNDLRISGINGPSQVTPDQAFSLSATVSNAGALAVSDYKVELYANDTLVDEKPGVELRPGDKASYSFEHAMNIAAPAQSIFTVNVAFDKDEDTSNNLAQHSVEMNLPAYPVASGLVAEHNGTSVNLAWQEPEMTDLPKLSVTDHFENYAPWSISGVGEWTLVDGDGVPIGGISDLTFGTIVRGETKCAYYVMNDNNLPEAFAAHSGHQYMVSTYLYVGGVVADWMISPMLSGEAQTISFYAKSYNANYPESFKVLYSTTGNDIDNFIEVESYSDVPDVWTEYTFPVPEGSVYFAIFCDSDNAFMFFVDDVTYTPANAESLNLTILGYNIYRNGEKINDTPISATQYSDPDGKANDEYMVTVVYPVGESAPSEPAMCTLGAHDFTDTQAISIITDRQSIIVTGATGNVTVSTVDGKLIYSHTPAPIHAISVRPGVYIVATNTLAQKVFVR